ncbi:hypothetical protein CAEBREN_00402 [Caenorhabditis brenneri]|uniref:Uncharacterized protein n=1 Tax=Caenorhabditis brenneri TaxID=135651 RepID=G0PIT8_CAEBE|nr:hypothetical protein CAEBREN_00402 [Caenorhabditis brenneri]
MIAARRDVVPFCLEITPTEPFKIPNDGFLEVKISNNTIHPYAIDITFDSFFFALQHEFLVKRECQGYSNTARSGFDYLEPTDSVTYKIGFSNEIIKKDQERMERWGHSLEVQNGLVYKIYKNDKGEVMKFDHFDRKDELLEKMAMDIPEDLEKIDGMTDEEVKKLRKEGMEKVKKNDEFWEKVREADANLDKEWPTDIIIGKVPESKVEKLEESKTKPIKTEEKPRKSVIKQVEKPKSEVKKVEKPVIKPLPNSETIPASIKSAPPPPTKPEIPVKIEPKKEAVKLKKKNNPCCEIM